jgi:hypothetical protein
MRQTRLLIMTRIWSEGRVADFERKDGRRENNSQRQAALLFQL